MANENSSTNLGSSRDDVLASPEVAAMPAVAVEHRGTRASHPETPVAALAALQDGNKRFREGKIERRDHSAVGERFASEQKPFAAILTCADSRISPELIFDVERGNLFISRIAGNGVDVGTLGSTEYAVAVLGVKLVMVLGHSDCGAVKAALAVAQGTASYPPAQYGSIGEVVGGVVRAVQGIPPGKGEVERAVIANARAQAAALQDRDPIVKPAVRMGKLSVVPAVYDIRSGKVARV